MFPDKFIKRIPREVPKNSKEKQGYIENFSKLSEPALTEILERQTKLLTDRVFIQKLPDRGARLKNLKLQLENEIKKRHELSDVCEVMSGLTVNGKELSETLEWSVRNQDHSTQHNNTSGNPKDDEDEDVDPLKIIASHSGAGFHQKKYRKVKEPEPLIKPSDVAIDEEENDIFKEEPYVASHRNKFDLAQSKERYLPFKTLVKENVLKNTKVRDVTAASPPLVKLGNVKQVSLKESMQLQGEQAKHLREVQVRHAADRLREKGSVSMFDVLPPPETTAHYRESPPSDSEEEILDEDAKEEPGGVTFPLANS